MDFVLFMPRFDDASFVWQTSSIASIYLGSIMPTAWSLDFAVVLALMAITVPLVNSRPMVVLLAVGLVAGIVAGIWAERYSNGRHTDRRP